MAIWFCTFSSRVVQKYKCETKYQGVPRSGFVLPPPAWFKSTNTKRSIKGSGDLVLYFLLPRGSKVQMRNEVSRVSVIWFCTFTSRMVQKYKYETKYQGVRRSGFVLSSPAWFKSTNTKRSIKGSGDLVLYFLLSHGSKVQIRNEVSRGSAIRFCTHLNWVDGNRQIGERSPSSSPHRPSRSG